MASGANELLKRLTALHKMGIISFNDFERTRSFLQDFDYISNPEDPIIWKSIGNIFFKENDYDMALKCYENAVGLDHFYIDALNNIGMTLKIMGRWEDAEKIFDYIESIPKENLISPVQTEPGTLNQQAEMVNEAIRLKNLGKYDDALLIYNFLLTLYPNDNAVMINKAILLKNMNKVSQAIKLYDLVLEKEPDSFIALANKGTALWFIGEFDTANSYYDRALKISPNNAVILEYKRQVIERMDIVKTDSPTQKNLDEAMYQMRKEQYDDALKLCDKILITDSHNKDAIQISQSVLNAKGLELIQKKEFDKAILNFEKILVSNPHSISAFLNLSVIYEKIGNHEKAIKYCESALEIDSENLDALNNMGYNLFLSGSISEAIIIYDKVLRLIPPENLDLRLHVENNKKMALIALQASKK